MAAAHQQGADDLHDQEPVVRHEAQPHDQQDGHRHRGIEGHRARADPIGEAHQQQPADRAQHAAERGHQRRGLAREFERFEHQRAPGGPEIDRQAAGDVADPQQRRDARQIALEQLADMKRRLGLAFVAQHEFVGGRRAQCRIDAVERGRHLVGPQPARDEEARRFGQVDEEQHGRDERADAAGDIDALPAMMRRDQVGERPGAGGADAVAHHDQGHDGRTQPARHEFDIERPGERQHAADGEAVEEAQRDELGERLRQCGHDRQHAEDEGRGNDRRPPSDHVGEPGEEEAARHHPGDAGREHPAQLVRAKMELVADIGRGVADHHLIEAVERRDQPGDDDQFVGETAELALLDQLSNVDRAPRTRHGIPSPALA